MGWEERTRRIRPSSSRSWARTDRTEIWQTRRWFHLCRRRTFLDAAAIGWLNRQYKRYDGKPETLRRARRDLYAMARAYHKAKALEGVQPLIASLYSTLLCACDGQAMFVLNHPIHGRYTDIPWHRYRKELPVDLR